MKKNQSLPRIDIEAMFAETDRLIKETDRQIKETDRQLKKEAACSRKELKEMRQEYRDFSKDMRKIREETSRELKELGHYVGGISHSNGALAEEYFYNAFKRNMTFVNESFDKIKKNLSYNNGDIGAEFDLVLFNGKSAALIEIKYNAKPDNIEIDTLISRVEVFKILFPEFAHYNIYLGVAAMSFRKDLVWRLHRAGIATIRPVGKKMVVYDKSVKVF